MLRDWNQMQYQLLGIVIAAACGYLLYVVISSVVHEQP